MHINCNIIAIEDILSGVTYIDRMTLEHDPKEQYDLKSALEELKRARFRITEPRVAILQALIANHGPFTVEEIHKLVTKRVCDLVTIYRCLASIEKAGLIKRCEFGDGTARYELCEKKNHHHHHVICKSCKKIETLDDCELQEIDRFARKRGFAQVSHSLEFFGLCPACK